MSSSKLHQSASLSTWLLPVGIVGAALVLGAALSTPSTTRVAIAVSIAIPAVALTLHRPNAALYALVVWLAALGTLRRLTTGISAAYSLGDPLLLVGPVVLATIALVAVRRGALRHRTPLTNCVMILIGALALSVLNPLQGGLAVGLGGALLVVVPMFAFFIGRALISDSALRRILGLYAALALLAAGYGLYQTFAGFPSWDQRWIDQVGYTALSIGSVIRAFGSFASGAEYAMFLVVGLICWLTLGPASRWRLMVVPATVLLALAIWYESARGAVVLLVAALAMVLAARLGQPIGRSLLIGALAIVAIPSVVGIVAPAGFGSDPASQLGEHQISGLASPFGPGSTLPAHIDIAVEALGGMLREPLGTGVGSVTVAAEKLGGKGGSAEVDPGNAAMAAGVLGFGGYVLVAALGLRRAYKRAAGRRDPLALAALGVLFATFFQWLNGGQYTVAILPWLVLGWLDRPEDKFDTLT